MSDKPKEIEVEKAVFNKLIAAAAKALPAEACGILGGTNGKLVKFCQLTNADESAEHYSMLPEEQFAAAKAIRKEGLQMKGIWHSHPSTPARMSNEDIRLAFMANTPYLILSLADTEPDLKAYWMGDGIPDEIPIRFTD